MLLSCEGLDPRVVYQCMVQAIIPRPIAWVLSPNADGSLNLAPFSFFNGVTSRPPILSISVGRRRDGSRKDTWVNVEERGDFVVNLPSVPMADAVSATSASFAAGESEVTQVGVAVEGVPGWPLPRVRDAGVAFLCRRHRIVEVGDGPQGLILGEIRAMFFSDTSASSGSETGRMTLDPVRLDPLGRLGGDDYAALGRVFSVERPD